MSTTPPVPHHPGSDPPKGWWRRVNWSVALRVPGALAACGTVAIGFYLIARWAGEHISGTAAVAACAAALLVLGIAAFPLFRKLFRALVGVWVRLVHRHRAQGDARRRYPRYAEIFEHRELLGMSMKELCRAVGISPRVGRWLARHPQMLVHEELIRGLSEALLLDPDYVQGARDDLGEPYVERRLFHYWSHGLARAWTWTQILEAGPETRRVILQSIETMRREDIHALKPGGEDA